MLKINYVGRLFENTFKVEKHTHSTWEVVYYTSGKGYVEIGGEKIPFAENDIFVIPPNIPHTDYAKDGFRNYHYNLSEFEYNRTGYIEFRDDENKNFLRMITQLHYEFHLRRNNWTNIVNSICDVLTQYMISFTESFNKNEYVEKVINDIIYNFSDPDFDINEALDKTHLNKDYFRRLFVKHTGKTPLQFLTSKRITFAKQLLSTQKQTDMQICEIAWRCGFSNCYYFSRVFKKETGMSPKAWADSYANEKNIDTEHNEPIPTRYFTPQ